MKPKQPTLVVIDMQVEFIDKYRERLEDLDESIEMINYAIDTFRRSNFPIIFVKDIENRQATDHEAAIIPQLKFVSGDLIAHKVHGNSFRSEEFLKLIKDLESDFFVFCGFKSEGCVLATAMGANDQDLSHCILRGSILSPDKEKTRFVESLNPMISYELLPLLLES
ncbi:MAG: isochorismatase family protein [Pseudobacteriovorax sp.]|nr:isochorismatase family protein [Pseudobacteriovorax sp.]